MGFDIKEILDSEYANQLEENNRLRKLDQGKLRMDLIPPEINIELAKVLTYGLRKGYKEDGWREVEDFRYIAAAMRHFSQWRMGEKNDPESNIKHLTHLLANISFLLVKEIENE